MRILLMLLIGGLIPVYRAYGITCGDKLSSATGDTLAWMERHYLYPQDGPNYDWPDSQKPRILQGFVYALDGTRIPVHRHAYEVSLTKGNSMGVDLPETAVSYRINVADSDEALAVWNDLKALFKSVYNLDFETFKKEQYDQVFEVRGRKGDIDFTLTVPGRFQKGGIRPEAGTFVVNYSIRRVQHFYFSRNHVMVVNNTIRLSDGTQFALYPAAGTCDPSIGTIEGEQPLLSISYTHTVTDVQNIDSEFVKLYTFLARQMKFDPGRYTLWDTMTDGFIIAYQGSGFEVRVTAPPEPVEGGLHTSYRAGPEDRFLYLYAQIFLNGKRQNVPGREEALWRASKPDEAGTESMAKWEVDPVQEGNRKRTGGDGSEDYGGEEGSEGPGLLDDM